ncbi:hypothetical protein E4U60_004925 [Claviceps pazoutovae]|uniref:Uncharacterized protein n=1 Tax=Claviceps pazoutovae TaxID=1649127 RepID=A0A9P7M8M7_9HYPO|nr:hypothetical protein E4U60_004925 [Claviceps pazoutovae]
MPGHLVNGTNGSHEGHSEPRTGADDAVEAQTSTVPTPTVIVVTFQELRVVLERQRRQRETARAVTNGHGPTLNEHRQNRNPMLPLRLEVGGISLFYIITGTTNGWYQLCAEFLDEDLIRTLLDNTRLTD